MTYMKKTLKCLMKMVKQDLKVDGGGVGVKKVQVRKEVTGDIRIPRRLKRMVAPKAQVRDWP